MRPHAPPPPAPTLVAARDQAWLIPTPGERMLVRVRGADVGGACTVIESVAAPMSGPPLHVHEAEDEAFHILEGTLRFRCEGREFDAPAGASVTVPRGLVHTWANRSDAPARMLVVFTPGGAERLFEAIDGRPPSAIGRLAAGFGTRIVGPPLLAG